MRLWSIDPAQLDRAALIAGWREGLLAQKVLRGATRGYRNHPQLTRFRELDDPVLGVATWLHGLADDADRRGYRFDRTRLVRTAEEASAGGLRLPVTDGQLGHEWTHLLAKCEARSPDWHAALVPQRPRAHPMLDVVAGPVADWERA
ncbi:pyrimidine dimer DNA glycosylase/endonuclease V [Arsenicicoccus piscis]|uniref:Pyrimidine dimer DNA glycosylase /DNA-(Apurinic or apyrimidinic site) lyase n=1 Tax=Arsenicicoccus piscis TaxID=673954 RepID=A0ABQ6HQ56_9MICO|nr:pyrimidine dimer DNA glycosylase/endonuclease V [Arsenicicoccus piscis]MCH8628833.1 pyrimidine dimer DNA glycosylase/endonuclease V [Arsenicicoccus piscis]GMA20117.1 pyrimidine dimer DNA glycosylase /DNA-(apurinic or apyrimidinic site) lyase [Arsenicicoccus piscis]